VGAVLIHTDLGQVAWHGLPAKAGNGKRDLTEGHDVPFDSDRSSRS
jgi:hypothetical protein